MAKVKFPFFGFYRNQTSPSSDYHVGGEIFKFLYIKNHHFGLKPLTFNELYTEEIQDL